MLYITRYLYWSGFKLTSIFFGSLKDGYFQLALIASDWQNNQTDLKHSVMLIWAVLITIFFTFQVVRCIVMYLNRPTHALSVISPALPLQYLVQLDYSSCPLRGWTHSCAHRARRAAHLLLSLLLPSADESPAITSFRRLFANISNVKRAFLLSLTLIIWYSLRVTIPLSVFLPAPVHALPEIRACFIAFHYHYTWSLLLTLVNDTLHRIQVKITWTDHVTHTNCWLNSISITASSQSVTV